MSWASTCASMADIVSAVAGCFWSGAVPSRLRMRAATPSPARCRSGTSPAFHLWAKRMAATRRSMVAAELPRSASAARKAATVAAEAAA